MHEPIIKERRNNFGRGDAVMILLFLFVMFSITLLVTEYSMAKDFGKMVQSVERIEKSCNISHFDVF